MAQLHAPRHQHHQLLCRPAPGPRRRVRLRPGQPTAALSCAPVRAARSSMPSAASASAPPSSPVDRTDRVLDGGAERAQVSGGQHDLAAGGHHVLDHGDLPAGHVGALGQSGGPVGLGLLADEGGGQAGDAGERDDDGDRRPSRGRRAPRCARAPMAPSRATSSSRIGSASNRYLSKYSVAVRPERSVNVPTRWDARWTLRASSVSGSGSAMSAGITRFYAGGCPLSQVTSGWVPVAFHKMSSRWSPLKSPTDGWAVSGNTCGVDT